jgi:hypothetical protein
MRAVAVVLLVLCCVDFRPSVRLLYPSKRKRLVSHLPAASVTVPQSAHRDVWHSVAPVDLPRFFQPVITEDFKIAANSFGVR